MQRGRRRDDDSNEPPAGAGRRRRPALRCRPSIGMAWSPSKITAGKAQFLLVCSGDCIARFAAGRLCNSASPATSLRTRVWRRWPIVNTPADRARQYFQYRPTRVLLAADPDVRTHQAFGLPKIGFVADGTDPAELHWPQRATMAQFLAPQFNPTASYRSRKTFRRRWRPSTKRTVLSRPRPISK